MQRGVVIGRNRGARLAALSQWLPALLRPASSGPVRYWQDRTRLAVKAALAAAAAWALAKYAAGQADPYFAPIAAVLGVYPTVARSLREVVAYVAGFLLGAAMAVPLAIGLGPSIAGIAIVVLAGMLVSGWQRLGDQSAQVTFTALFVLLLGGDQPLHYLTHRAVDVGIGLATGLAVNLLAFPPLQLRPAEHAIRQWGETSRLPCVILPPRRRTRTRLADSGSGTTASSPPRPSGRGPRPGRRGRACGGTRGRRCPSRCRAPTGP